MANSSSQESFSHRQFISTNAIPILDKFSEKPSGTENELYPLRTPPRNERILVHTDVAQEREHSVLLELCDVILEEETIAQILPVLQKVINNSSDEKVIYQTQTASDGTRYACLSREAIQLFLKKAWFQLLFLPNIKEHIEKAIPHSWKGKLAGDQSEFTYDQVRNWNFALAKKPLPETEALRDRTVLHEQTHHISLSRNNQVLLKLKQFVNGMNLSGATSRADADRIINTIEQLQKIIVTNDVVDEAEAILHEICGSPVLELQHLNFSEELWTRRLPPILSRILLTSENTIELEVVLKRWFSGDVLDHFSQDIHILGTLILLFEGQILSSSQDKLFDFTKVLGVPNESIDFRYLMGRILERIKEVQANPQQFAENLITHDVKSQLVRAMNQRQIYLGKFIQKIGVSSSLSPVGFPAERQVEIKTDLAAMEQEEKASSYTKSHD